MISPRSSNACKKSVGFRKSSRALDSMAPLGRSAPGRGRQGRERSAPLQPPHRHAPQCELFLGRLRWMGPKRRLQDPSCQLRYRHPVLASDSQLSGEPVGRVSDPRADAEVSTATAPSEQGTSWESGRRAEDQGETVADLVLRLHASRSGCRPRKNPRHWRRLSRVATRRTS